MVVTEVRLQSFVAVYGLIELHVLGRQLQLLCSKKYHFAAAVPWPPVSFLVATGVTRQGSFRKAAAYFTLLKTMLSALG